MALRADNSVNDSSIWHLITEPSPGRLAFAVRLALICTLVAVFSELYRTPEIALTVYVVFFLNKPDRTSSMLLTVAIVVIITVVVGILLVIAPPLLAHPGLRVLTMALISFVMMFLGSASKLKPVASILALVIAYALDILGSVPLGEAATRGVLYLWLFFGIPALVSIVVNLLIAPSPRSLVQKAIAERLRAAAAALSEGSDGAGHSSMRSLLMDDEETQKHLKLAGLEKTNRAEDIAALKGATDCVVTVLSAVQLMLEEPQALPAENLKRKVETKLIELADIFDAGGYPARVEPIEVDADCGELAISAIAFLNSGVIQFGDVRPAVNFEKRRNRDFFRPTHSPIRRTCNMPSRSRERPCCAT